MAAEGADGETRNEMSRALHLPDELENVRLAFMELRGALERAAGRGLPVALRVANRLFAQRGAQIRPEFLRVNRESSGAPLELLDFARDPNAARIHINSWVAEQTRDRIRDLIPEDGIDRGTKLVLANALYFKAPWTKPFELADTRPEPFRVRGGEPAQVPMMQRTEGSLQCKTTAEGTAVALPYAGGEFQLLLVLPRDVNGLGKLEAQVAAHGFEQFADLPSGNAELHVPKFKLAAPTVALAPQLKAMGIRTAFDEPPGSANFERIAPRAANGGAFALSQVFHKTFIAVDENGTEAAAASAAVMSVTAMPPSKIEPTVIRFDHPFFYAVQHVASGACSFIGRVVDPR